MKNLPTIKLSPSRRHRSGAIWTDAELLALHVDDRKHELWSGNWMVDLRNRSVRVYRPGESFELLKGNRVLTGNSVVPGFRISLSKLFESI